MSNTLVTPGELSGFPGAPFDDTMVDIAAASVRAEAGWHIAPVLTETLRISTWGGYDLRIPSLRIVSISAIRFEGVAYDPASWSSIPYGLYRYSGWPTGVVEVDIVHGYDQTPMDLLPVLAARAKNATNPRDPSLSQLTTTRGPFTDSMSYRTDAASVKDPTVARYSLITGIA